MSSALDMSLDDIIKNNKKSSAAGGRRGRRGRGADAGPTRRPPNRATNRSNPYSMLKAGDYKGYTGQIAAYSIPMAMVSSIETGTKLYISNLDYGVSNDDIKLEMKRVHFGCSGKTRRSIGLRWSAMKLLCASLLQAVEAYSSGNRTKANYLLEEGKYHNRRAREADEKSSLEILEAKKSPAENDVPLDLHTHNARDSIRLLKKHLVSLANLRVFRYLKIIINTDADDTTKGKRKRIIIKLLERESVKWAEEEGNPDTILIRLSEIDSSKFTFMKDQQ